MHWPTGVSKLRRDDVLRHRDGGRLPVLRPTATTATPARQRAIAAGTCIATPCSVSVPLLSTDTTLERERPLGTVGLWLLDQVRMEAWDRVLFVECGDGWLVEEAWRRMRKGRVVGLSTSPWLVDLAVQLRGVPGLVEFSTWGGERFPLPDRSFDRVISCASLGRYREPSALLHEVARVLRPGGDAYLFDGDPTPLAMPKLLAEASLVEAQRNRCDSMPMVIRACPSWSPT